MSSRDPGLPGGARWHCHDYEEVPLMLEMEGWSPLLDKGVGPMGLVRVAPQGRGGLPRPQGTVKAEFLL